MRLFQRAERGTARSTSSVAGTVLVEERFDEDSPVLSFTPAAWIKLNWLAHAGETEIGGFGLIPDPKELLVSEFQLIDQRCTAVSVAFEDGSVADYFEQRVDEGYQPGQFARCWLHTHPGDSPHPSGTDERTFRRVFGGCDWAVMFILARGGQTYARLRFAAGPGGQLVLPVAVRWDLPIEALDDEAWADEYAAHIQPLADLTGTWPPWWDEMDGKSTSSAGHPDIPVWAVEDDARLLATEVADGRFD